MTARRGVLIGFGVLAAALVALVVALVIALGGDHTPGRHVPPATETPGGLRGVPGGMPPGIAECLADQGYELKSPADLHSAPPQAVQACFEALHQGGGAP